MNKLENFFLSSFSIHYLFKFFTKSPYEPRTLLLIIKTKVYIHSNCTLSRSFECFGTFQQFLSLEIVLLYCTFSSCTIFYEGFILVYGDKSKFFGQKCSLLHNDYKKNRTLGCLFFIQIMDIKSVIFCYFYNVFRSVVYHVYVPEMQ